MTHIGILGVNACGESLAIVLIVAEHPIRLDVAMDNAKAGLVGELVSGAWGRFCGMSVG